MLNNIKEPKKEEQGRESDNERSCVGGVSMDPEPAASRRREGGRQRKVVKYTFDDDEDEDIPGLSDGSISPQPKKRRKRVDSDDEFELST